MSNDGLRAGDICNVPSRRPAGLWVYRGPAMPGAGFGQFTRATGTDRRSTVTLSTRAAVLVARPVFAPGLELLQPRSWYSADHVTVVRENPDGTVRIDAGRAQFVVDNISLFLEQLAGSRL